MNFQLAMEMEWKCFPSFSSDFFLLLVFISFRRFTSAARQQEKKFSLISRNARGGVKGEGWCNGKRLFVNVMGQHENEKEKHN